MKFFFFIALLMNIILFLWEVKQGGLNSPLEMTGVDSHQIKQILLVSELLELDNGNNFKIVENSNTLYDQIVSLELNSGTNSKKEVETEESSQQLIESNATVIEGFPENLISSNELPQSEQKTLEHDKAITATSEQGDSKDSIQQLIKNKAIVIEDFPGILIRLNAPPQNEQNTLLHKTIFIAATGQINSAPIISVLEEKPFTGDSHKEVAVNSLLNSDESNTEQADPDNNYCYHVGPFANDDALNVWRKLNEIDIDSLSYFNKESNVVSSHLVYFPAAKTFAQSRKNLQRLKQKGITDYWLFRRGELKGAISLGLFAKKSRALAMQEKLVKAGFTIEIKERYKKEQLLYAEISTEDKAFKDTVIIPDKQSVSICENNTH